MSSRSSSSYEQIPPFMQAQGLLVVCMVVCELVNGVVEVVEVTCSVVVFVVVIVVVVVVGWKITELDGGLVLLEWVT